MPKKVKVVWDKKAKKPKKEKDEKGGRAVNVLPDGTIELVSNGITTKIDVETWNHGAGWNSITIDFED